MSAGTVKKEKANNILEIMFMNVKNVRIVEKSKISFVLFAKNIQFFIGMSVRNVE